MVKEAAIVGGDHLARHMLERDEVGVAASLLRRRGRRAAFLIALQAVCLARPTTPATYHRQRRRSCIAVPRGGGQDSATSAASEASAAAIGPHGPSAVRRTGPEVSGMGAEGRQLAHQCRQRVPRQRTPNLTDGNGKAKRRLGVSPQQHNLRAPTPEFDRQPNKVAACRVSHTLA